MTQNTKTSHSNIGRTGCIAIFIERVQKLSLLFMNLHLFRLPSALQQTSLFWGGYTVAQSCTGNGRGAGADVWLPPTVFTIEVVSFNICSHQHNFLSTFWVRTTHIIVKRRRFDITVNTWLHARMKREKGNEMYLRVVWTSGSWCDGSVWSCSLAPVRTRACASACYSPRSARWSGAKRTTQHEGDFCQGITVGTILMMRRS